MDRKKHSWAETGWPNKAEGLEGLLTHGLWPKAVNQVGGAAGLARRWDGLRVKTDQDELGLGADLAQGEVKQVNGAED